ncbi:hypothetical protein C5167_025030, partial [Papaver somniferum]
FGFFLSVEEKFVDVEFDILIQFGILKIGSSVVISKGLKFKGARTDNCKTCHASRCTQH